MENKAKNPFRLEFRPRPLLDTEMLLEYIIICKDNKYQYHCFTNMTDPIKIAGYKEMMQIAFANSFTEVETHVSKFNN